MPPAFLKEKTLQTYFQDNESDKLIVLFNGWGMDEKPFLTMKSTYDILYVFDYNDLKLEHEIDFSKYSEKILLAFSAGVFMASLFQDKFPVFDKKIAVNGTLNLFDEEKGLSDRTVKDLEGITLENALEFRKKLILKSAHLDIFNKTQPSRSLESSLKELDALKKHVKKTNFSYDKIIIGKEDKIIPFKNQLAAWKGHKNITLVDAGHFPFYEFKSLDELAK